MANTEICDKMFDILLTSSPVMENMARNVSLAVLDWYNGIMVYGPHYGVIGEQLHESGNNSLLGQCGEKKANWRIMGLALLHQPPSKMCICVEGREQDLNNHSP